MADLLPPVVAELRAHIGDFQTKMAAARGELDTTVSHGRQRFDQLALAGKMAFLGLAGAGAIVAGFSIKQALEGQKAHAQLVNAVQRSGHAYREFGPTIDATSEKFAHLGFENDLVEAALTRMTIATKNPQAALDNLGLAADVARGRHIDLESASSLVAKAMGGNSRALKAMGIDLKQLGVDANDPVAILGALNDRFGGAAQAHANTYAGKMEAVNAQVKNLAEKIGNMLLPIIAKLAGALSDGVDWLGKHRTASLALAVVVGGILTAAFTAWAISAASAAVATLAAAGPFILIGAAIAALVAGAILLGVYWDQVWAFVANNPYVLAVLAPLGAVLLPIIALVGIIKLLWDNWDQIWGWISQAATDAANWITNAFNDVIAFFAGMPGQIWAFLSGLPTLLIDLGGGLMGGLWDGVKAVWGLISGWLGKLWGFILDGIGDLGNTLFGVGEQVIRGLWNGMKSIWHQVTGWLSSLDPTNWFNDINPHLGHAITNMHATGEMVMTGLQRGMMAGWADTARWLRSIDPVNVVGTPRVSPAGAAEIGASVALSAASTSAPSSAPSVVNHLVTIEVHADATTDEVGIGRAIAEKLQFYYDAGGKPAVSTRG